jgi:CRP-like cAMP-binding protein
MVTAGTNLGKEFVIRLLPSGRLYGLISALDGHGNLHSARAFGPTQTWFIGAAAFRGLIRRYPELYPQLTRLLCLRARIAQRTIETAALMPVRQRLASRLLELVRALGKASPAGPGVLVPVGQDAIAGLVGATRQSVNRELKAMERSRTIAVARRHLVVLDRAVLEAEAGEVTRT